ncbi:serine/threonine-protein phosphatase 7 long form [Capsicum chacoense]
MAERWRPETHTFHLPFGEVTITLQDVEVLFGLRTDGDAVAYGDEMDRNLDWRTMLRDFTGLEVVPAAINGHDHISIATVVNYLCRQLLFHPLTDETPEDRVQSITRLYMLLLMGGILFTNTSGGLLSLRYLYFLRDLDRIGDYSWGSAVLAYLYWSLCRASMGMNQLQGFVPLVQIWTWEMIRPFMP